MDENRRSFLKGLASVGVAAGTASVAAVVPMPAEASEPHTAPDDAVGMLYDTTLCIGCKTCVVACKDWHSGTMA